MCDRIATVNPFHQGLGTTCACLPVYASRFDGTLRKIQEISPPSAAPLFITKGILPCINGLIGHETLIDVLQGFIPLPKSVSRERIIFNTQIYDFAMTEDEMKELDSLDERELTVRFRSEYIFKLTGLRTQTSSLTGIQAIAHKNLKHPKSYSTRFMRILNVC